MKIYLKRASMPMLAITALLLACGTGTTPSSTVDSGPGASSTSSSGAGDGLHFYADPCGTGDPVGCVFQHPVEIPDSTIKKCSELGRKSGDACTTENERCVLTAAMQEGDAGGFCRQSASFLTCLPHPRQLDVGGCPVSTRRAKTNIHYLDDQERTKLARDVLQLAIASYDYKSDADGPSPSLGFMLEDAPDARFVMREHSRVNLYSYVSSLVVTAQEQQKQIEMLRREVDALRSQRSSASNATGKMPSRKE